MSTLNRDILSSGAGVAGPVVAYWLRRYGFNPTVVEHAPTIRTAGPHAVDLWGAAVGIVERMGILSEVEAARTRNEIGVQIRPGRPAIELPVGELSTSFSDRGVEIPRFELTQLLYRAGSEEVEYIFGDSVAACP